jgi:glycosyltransferase involved in cell wall biosynthesis
LAKFLVIHPNLDVYGGGERVCHHIIKALVGHGQQVDLLSFDFDQNVYAEIMGEKLPDGINLHSLGKRIEAEPPFSVYKRRGKIIAAVKKFKESHNYDYTFSTQTFSAFEAELLDKAKKNIAYVHFPEIHFDYDHSATRKKFYLWLYKKLLEWDIGKLNLVFCNSNYTKTMTEKYWGKFGITEPVVAYPPVEDRFWSSKPIAERAKRVVYIARFTSRKRHEIMKQLAAEFPAFEFVSVGGLRDTEQKWFEGFSKDLPSNYTLKPNLAERDLIALLQNSRIYLHLMEGEHFGIAPMEALAAGCVTLVHNSGGSGEFIPEEFGWTTPEDLKEKMAKLSASPEYVALWESKKDALRGEIAVLKPVNFEEKIWSNVYALMMQTENDMS